MFIHQRLIVCLLFMSLLTTNCLYAKPQVTNEKTILSLSKIISDNNQALSGKTIIVDVNRMSTPLKLHDVQNVVIDWQNRLVKCNQGFVELGNGCQSIEIKNVNAIGSGKGSFVNMPSTPSVKSGLFIHDNQLSEFSVGISFNADLAGLVIKSRIVNNKISNIRGSDPGSGYGIHLANVQNCIVEGNIIDHAERHSIYHAWGRNNRILSNVIKNHRRGMEFSASKFALAVFRSSVNIDIESNKFENNNASSIFIYAGNDESGVNPKKYSDQSKITIKGNEFFNDASELNRDAIGIMIGFNVLQNYTDYRTHEKNVVIKNNSFTYYNTPAINAIRLYTGSMVSIVNNIFNFNGLGQDNSALIHIASLYCNEAKFSYNIKNNVFNSIGDNTQPMYIFYVEKDKMGKKKLVLRGNQLNSHEISGCKVSNQSFVKL